MNRVLPYALCSLAAVSTSYAEKKVYEPTVESLRQYECPDWFRDAKFGIYLHWGAYSVAEKGEWYARRLYEEDRPDHAYHLKTYGHPSEFGYADFIPMWKAEKFDPDALLALFKKAGAKYFTPCAVHHDNFDLWDSPHQPWNSVNMGPKKDITKLWKDATLKAGLRFGVTTHLSRSYSWLNTANQTDKNGKPFDGALGKAKGLYPPNDEQSTHARAPFDAPQSWRDNWKARINQLVTDYDPDLLYFDCAVPFRGSDEGKTGLEVISHFYNERSEGVMCIKERPWQGLYADGIATLDFERGSATHTLKEPWQTDDSIGSWGYNKDKPYTTPNIVVDKLIDNVSKNGNLLLNIPIKADGTLDKEATDILLKIGAWLDVNGEGIYGTRPWYRSGEGYAKMPPHPKKSPMKSRDIRYTTKGDVLYAFVMDWPKKTGTAKMEFLAPTSERIGKIISVELLGHTGDLKWEQNGDGLTVTFPKDKPTDYAHCLKIIQEK